MCLITNTPEQIISEKAIVVYKRLDGWKAHQQNGFKYTPLKSNKEVELIPLSASYHYDKSYKRFEQGYHSFPTYEDYLRIYDEDNCSVFVIPKGSKYVVGQYNGQSFTRNYISSNITFIGGKDSLWTKLVLWWLSID